MSLSEKLMKEEQGLKEIFDESIAAGNFEKANALATFGLYHVFNTWLRTELLEPELFKDNLFESISGESSH